MANTNRRNILQIGLFFVTLPSAMLHLGCTRGGDDKPRQTNDSPEDLTTPTSQNTKGKIVKIQYLEIVTPEVDAVCKTYSTLHGIGFSEPDQNLGGARIAKLDNGGSLAVRGPLRETEDPVVRHYILVEDIQTAVDEATKSGAEVAVPPMELPGHGTCAIVIQGGIEFGFWQA